VFWLNRWELNGLLRLAFIPKPTLKLGMARLINFFNNRILLYNVMW
jgi:hypothetical protein